MTTESLRDLYEGELYVAPGHRHPVVLQVQRHGTYGKQLGLFELTSAQDPRRQILTGPMTPDEAADRYGWITPVWRLASLAREDGPAPDIAVEHYTTSITERVRDVLTRRGPRGAR